MPGTNSPDRRLREAPRGAAVPKLSHSAVAARRSLSGEPMAELYAEPADDTMIEEAPHAVTA